MKKLLISALALTMGVTCAAGLVACGNDDNEIAVRAINNVKALYEKASEETPRTYEVVGQTKVDDNFYDVKWEVSAESNDISDYVKVENMDEETLMVSITVTRGAVDMEYSLKASVTVGKKTQSYSFKRKVPKKAATDNKDERETKDVSITFDSSDKYKVEEGKVVYEENGIKVTATSFSETYLTKPMRFYAGSKVIIEYPGMKHLEIDSVTFDDSDYAGPIKTGMENAGIPATVSITDGDAVIDLKYAMDRIEFTAPAQIRMYALDITAVVGGANDAEKVEAAKDLTALSQTIFSEKGEYDLPATSYGANLTWSVKGTSNLVKVESGKLVVENLPEEKTAVTLAFTAKCGNEEANGEVEISVIPSTGLTHAGTKDDPFTTAEVIRLAATVDRERGYYTVNGTVTAVFVEGYVVDTGSWSSNYNNWQNVYISSDPNGSKESADAVMIYGLIVDGTYIKTQADLVKGSKITVSGALQNYYDTPEITFYNSSKIQAQAVAYEKADGTVTPPESQDGTATIAYTAGTTGNMSGDNDANTVFGLDASVFTIKSEKTGSNHVGLNKDGSIRLYKGASCTLIIGVASGCTIESIKVTLTSASPAKLDSLTVSVGGQSVTGTDGVYTVNGTSVSLSNADEAGQIHISSIVITYSGTPDGSGSGSGGTENPPATGGFTAITTPAAGEYTCAMDIKGTLYYLTGELSGNFAASSTNASEAAKIELIADGEGWLIKANGKYVEIISSTSGDKTYNNIKFNDARATEIHWVWNDEHKIFTWTNDNGTLWIGTYGTFTTFSASYISYITNANQYPAKLGTGSGSTTNPGTGTNPGTTPSEGEASLTFVETNRTSFSVTQQVWSANGITLTNDKGESSSDVGDYKNPIRLYKNSSVKVEYTGNINTIVFNCATYQSNDYASQLEASLASVAGATVTKNGTVVTVTFASPVTSIEFVCANQIRLDSIVVNP